jgi:hypothetical protein
MRLLSLREKPKAAPTPKSGRGPGTGGASGSRTHLKEYVLLTEEKGNDAVKVSDVREGVG